MSFFGVLRKESLSGLTRTRQRISTDLAAIECSAEEKEEERAEQNSEELAEIRDEVTQLYEDIIQGRIMDGKTHGLFEVVKPHPALLEIPAVKTPKTPIGKGDQASRLAWLDSRFEQLHAVSSQLTDDLGSIRLRRESALARDTNPSVPQGSGIEAAVQKLADLEDQVMEIVQKPDGPWSCAAMVEYLALPGKTPSQVLDALVFELSTKVEDRESRATGFINSRRFQTDGFSMKVYGMKSRPHNMIFSHVRESVQSPARLVRSHTTSKNSESRAIMTAESDLWENLAPENVSLKSRLLGSGLTEIKCSWCPATHLFYSTEGSGGDNSIEQMKILRHVANSNGVPSPLNTVLGRAIVARAWQECQFLIQGSRCLDVMNLLCLVVLIINFKRYQKAEPASGKTNESFEDENKMLISILMIYSIYCLCMRGFEVFESSQVFGWASGLYVYFTSANTFLFVIEVMSSLKVLWIFVIVTVTPANLYDRMFENPVGFALAVFGRCLHFTVELLGTKQAGETLLPAFDAVTTPDSIMYLLFLLLVIFAMTMSYWVLPIDDNIHLRDALLKMFRLGALGDFDMNDLEGANQVIVEGEGVFHNETMLEDPPETVLHTGLREIFICFSTLLTIMLTNVYIALLSGTYDEMKEHSKTGLTSFRARKVIPVLLRQRFRGRLPWGNWFGFAQKLDKVTGFFITRSVNEFS
eukprot:TRINITY_DN5161_c3_g1_i5.p1 TRINITY_DN5161_c3_g1~~TRINITY_DN5161_c3_g1_i5.p1  ORF type:complete len:697 (-),score=99.56 TRINITY_DN5161_c3_g1_i5:628-2718(-)